jgi:hypothetical protein
MAERPRSDPSLLSLTTVPRSHPPPSSLDYSSLQSLTTVLEYQRLLMWLTLAPDTVLRVTPLLISFANVLCQSPGTDMLVIKSLIRLVS